MQQLCIPTTLPTGIAVGSRQFVEPSEIIQLRAEINYTLLCFASGKKLLISYTLKRVMNSLLPYASFIRVNRSTVVNQRFIHRIQGNIVHLKNQEVIPISRRRMKDVVEIIEPHLDK